MATTPGRRFLSPLTPKRSLSSSLLTTPRSNKANSGAAAGGAANATPTAQRLSESTPSIVEEEKKKEEAPATRSRAESSASSRHRKPPPQPLGDMAVLGISKGTSEKAKTLDELPKTFKDKGFEVVLFAPDKDNLVSPFPPPPLLPPSPSLTHPPTHLPNPTGQDFCLRSACRSSSDGPLTHPPTHPPTYLPNRARPSCSVCAWALDSWCARPCV